MKFYISDKAYPLIDIVIMLRRHHHDVYIYLFRFLLLRSKNFLCKFCHSVQSLRYSLLLTGSIRPLLQKEKAIKLSRKEEKWKIQRNCFFFLIFVKFDSPFKKILAKLGISSCFICYSNQKPA